MKGNALVRTASLLAVLSVLATSGFSLPAGEINITRTNLVERWITNLIDVRMPLNRFVNEYHTNWITQMRTNIIDIYSTNWVTRTLTNPIVVDSFHTNFFTQYHTNWQTFNLTNWQTAVVIKTNWVTQTLTNVLESDAPARRPAIPESPAPKKDEPREVIKIEPAPTGPTSVAMDGLILEAVRTVRASPNGQIEVQLKVRSAAEPDAPLQIQQWKIEREDGAILCFGQDQDFKRDLPAGKYRVEVKVQPGANGALRIAKGTLALTSREAVIQPRLTARK